MEHGVQPNRTKINIYRWEKLGAWELIKLKQVLVLKMRAIVLLSVILHPKGKIMLADGNKTY